MAYLSDSSQYAPDPLDPSWAFPQGYGDDWADSLRKTEADTSRFRQVITGFIDEDPVKALLAAEKARVISGFYFDFANAILRKASYWKTMDSQKAWALLWLVDIHLSSGEHTQAGIILDNLLERYPDMDARSIACDEDFAWLYAHGYANENLLVRALR